MQEQPFGTYAPTRLQKLIIFFARSTPLRRLLSRRRLGRLLTVIRPGPIDIAFQGAKFRVHPIDNPVEGGMLFYPDYNVREIDFLRSCLPRGGVFVDVGANVGLYSLPLSAHVGPEGFILAIEPGSVSLERLRFNVRASQAHNVVIAPYAIGEREGEAYLDVPPRNLGGAGINYGGKGERVALRRFPDVLSSCGLQKMDALKVDIEGYEDLVITQMFQACDKSLLPRGIVIEHLHRMGWRTDCFQTLEDKGYECTDILQSNALFRKKEV